MSEVLKEEIANHLNKAMAYLMDSNAEVKDRVESIKIEIEQAWEKLQDE